MASFSSRQWLAIIAGLILLISLFFINRKSPPKDDSGQSQANGHTGQVQDFNSLLLQAENQVPASVKSRIDGINKVLGTTPQPGQGRYIDSIVNLYDSVGAQIPANYYIEKLAQLQNSASLWFQAGDGYYKAAELMNAAARGSILQRGIACFTNALKIDSNFMDAKVGMGECIVESGTNPMEGIAMIEGVLKRDSNNEKAQVALGEFSIQSGQYAKAIYRFNRVLKIDPSYIQAYLYLAQAYENSGNKPDAISNLKKYSTFAKDSALKSQVDKYIEKMENDTNSPKNK